MTDTSKNGNAKHATSKSVNELMDKKDNDMTFTTLKNFDRKTIKELLAKKDKKVGDVVLVDGRPTVIRRRISGRVGGGERKTKKKLKVQNLELIKTIPGSFRSAKNARRRLQVKYMS